MTLSETPHRESHGGREMIVTKLHTPARVLVVEGDQATLMMLRFCLHSAGFQVTEAATGEDALRILDNQAADAVVVDLGLPRGGGKAVLDRVRMADPQPVWVATSVLDPEEVALYYGRMNGHLLPKPFDPWRLVGRLEQLILEQADRR